jgi:protein-S-isoprenylcysteine O-methyltransferase Ste14
MLNLEHRVPPPSEERALAALFGASWSAYAARVRHWL